MPPQAIGFRKLHSDEPWWAQTAPLFGRGQIYGKSQMIFDLGADAGRAGAPNHLCKKCVTVKSFPAESPRKSEISPGAHHPLRYNVAWPAACTHLHLGLRTHADDSLHP